ASAAASFPEAGAEHEGKADGCAAEVADLADAGARMGEEADGFEDEEGNDEPLPLDGEEGVEIDALVWNEDEASDEDGEDGAGESDQAGCRSPMGDGVHDAAGKDRSEEHLEVALASEGEFDGRAEEEQR